MRGIPFTHDMQTDDRLRRYIAYMLKSHYMFHYAEQSRGMPRISSQASGTIAQIPYHRKCMNEIEEHAKRVCPNEWAAHQALDYHTFEKQQEDDGFVSWIHRSETTRKAFVEWENRLKAGETVSWLAVDMVPSITNKIDITKKMKP